MWPCSNLRKLCDRTDNDTVPVPFATVTDFDPSEDQLIVEIGEITNATSPVSDITIVPNLVENHVDIVFHLSHALTGTETAYLRSVRLEGLTEFDVSNIALVENIQALGELAGASRVSL